MMSQQTHPPTEAEIETQLRQFQPLPTTRFYEKIRAVDWQQLDTTPPAQPNGQRKVMRFTRNRLLAAALFFVVLGASITLLPSLQALAQDMLRYFERTESNQKEFAYIAPLITATPEPNPWGSLMDYYPLNDEETSEKAGFDVYLPLLLPDDFRFEGATASYGFADLRFNGIDKLPYIRSIELMQYRVGSPIIRYNDVGSDAKVETIEITPSIVGEYVEGSWQNVDPDGFRIATPGTEVTQVYEWRDLGGAMLIWHDEDIVYQIMMLDKLTKENLIAIARCMYMPYDLLEPNARLGEQRRDFRDKNIDCDFASGLVTQTFIGPNQFVVFRQQPISAETPMPSVVEGDVTDHVSLTMPSGSVAEAEVVEGLWTDAIPDSHRLRTVSAAAMGLRWEADGLRLEAWIVGAGMSESAITLPLLIEISQTMQ